MNHDPLYALLFRFVENSIVICFGGWLNLTVTEKCICIVKPYKFVFNLFFKVCQEAKQESSNKVHSVLGPY